MQYHCVSLSELPHATVSFIGFGGEKCTPAVERNPRVEKIELSTPFRKWSRRFWLLWAPLKVVFQVWQLFWVLLTMPRADAVLVQNPPSIPTLLVARLATWMRCSRLVIDWHNFGFSILSHSLGEHHFLVWVAYWYECWLGWLGDDHFCVTDAMCQWLEREWGVRAQVLYDKAPHFFQRASVGAKHSLFRRLQRSLVDDQPDGARLTAQVPLSLEGSTLLTQPQRTGGVELRRDRPAVIVSSTSWTPDEDFGILLDALVEVDDAADEDPTRFPPFLVLVTGKGPQKAEYEARIAALGLRHVFIRTLWLEAGDYPVLMGCADLGVSLHVSTSGLDLPMKVVDMFGAGTPVCAVGFGCLGELVHHGRNGLVFGSASELASQILTLFEGWPASSSSSLSSSTAATAAAREESEVAAEGGAAAVCLRHASRCTREEREEAMEAARDAKEGASLLDVLAAGVAQDRETNDWATNWLETAAPVFVGDSS